MAGPEGDRRGLICREDKSAGRVEILGVILPALGFDGIGVPEPPIGLGFEFSRIRGDVQLRVIPRFDRAIALAGFFVEAGLAAPEGVEIE